jgi:hypothetical protein
MRFWSGSIAVDAPGHFRIIRERLAGYGGVQRGKVTPRKRAAMWVLAA